MAILEYPITHPYPHERAFTIATSAIVLLSLPVLILVNVVTNGYEVVPTLSPSYYPTSTTLKWWREPASWYWGHVQNVTCQPKDIGRGDTFYLTPSLFEYKVISTWKSQDLRNVSNEARVNYTGASFGECAPYQARFDYNLDQFTSAVTVGILCNSTDLIVQMETSVLFSNSDDITYSMIGKYWGFANNVFYFLHGASIGASTDYRQTVIGVLDIISTDLRTVMRQTYPSQPTVLNSLSTRVYNITDPPPLGFTFRSTYITSAEGSSKLDTSAFDIYKNSIFNLVYAVVAAITLDLQTPWLGNFFTNKSAVDNFASNLVPLDPLLQSDPSYFYNSIRGQGSWVQALKAEKLRGITPGNLTGLPPRSVISTNYLCPTYTRKPISSFLSSVFVGTATMCLSAWAAWKFVTAFLAKRSIKSSCVKCTCDSEEYKLPGTPHDV